MIQKFEFQRLDTNELWLKGNSVYENKNDI